MFDPHRFVDDVVLEYWVSDEIGYTVDGVTTPDIHVFGEQLPFRSREVTSNLNDVAVPTQTYFQLVDLLQQALLVLERWLCHVPGLKLSM